MYRSIRIVLFVLILIMAAYSANENANDLAAVQAEEAETGVSWIKNEGSHYQERLFVSFMPKDEEDGRRFLVEEAKRTRSTLFYIDYLETRFSSEGKFLSDGRWMFSLPEGALFWENIPGYSKEAPHRYATIKEEGYSQIAFLQERYARTEDNGIFYFEELDLENPPLDSTPHQGRWGLLTNEGKEITTKLRTTFPKAEVFYDLFRFANISWAQHQLRGLLLFLFFFVYGMFLFLRVEKERNIRLLLGRRLVDTYGRLYLLPFLKAYVLYLFSWQFFLLVFLKFQLRLFPWAFHHLKYEWKVLLLFCGVIVLLQLLFFALSEKKRRKGAKASFELAGFVPILFALLLIFLSISIPLFTKNSTALRGLLKTQKYLSDHPEKKENTGFNQAVLAFKNKEENLNQERVFQKDMQANRELRQFLEKYNPLVFETKNIQIGQLEELKEYLDLYKGPPWILLNQRMYEKLSLPLEKEPEIKDISKSKNLLLIIPKGKKLRKGDLQVLPTYNNKVHRVYLSDSFTMQDPTFRVGELRDPYFAVLPDEDLMYTLNFPSLFFEKLSEKEREEILAFIDEQEREPRWYFFEDNAKRMVHHQQKVSEEIRALIKTTLFSLAFVLFSVWFLELFIYTIKKKELSLEFLLGKNVYVAYLKYHGPLLMLELLILVLAWSLLPKISLGIRIYELLIPLGGVLGLQFLLGFIFFVLILKRGVNYMLLEGEI